MITKTIGLYKNAYTGLSKSTWLLSFVMLINRCGTMVVPFLTIYMTQRMGVGIGKAAMVMSVFGAGSIVGALIGGKITDRFGFYYVQLVALSGGGILFMLLGLMKSYAAICVTTFFLSLVNEAFRPANTVAVAHYSTEENRTRSYSLNRLAINLGWAVGSALGGFIAAHSYHLLFWVDGITNILAAILLYALMAPSRNQHTQQRPYSKPVTSQSVYRDKQYLVFIGLQILFAMCFFQLFSILPVYYKSQLHISESYIGLVMSCNGVLIVMIEMILVYKLEGRVHKLNAIAAGTLLVGLSYGILNAHFIPVLLLPFISMLIVTFGEMLAMPFMNSYWIARTNAGNRGAYAALFTMAWSAAQVMGPFLGGQVAEHYSYDLLWWISGSLCLLLSFVYFFMGKSSTPAVTKQHE